MRYKALYRQLRPLMFKDVAGQDHITKTLSNSVRNSYIAHAYLFAGPRGVGKTSIARILARAVNCMAESETAPCNKCSTCESILEGRALDVIEIDAASNNGVDEIRELREKVRYAPAECRYKVYIIDEVHMLSTAAFNALLKTLEEPPAHVIFILATTEAHKIPATIKSRCQRFNFHRIQKDVIINYLNNIAVDLNVVVEQEALELIARAADGAMRDAISILDQSLAYSENKITLNHVMNLLGAVDDQVFYNITNDIIINDMIAALREIAEIYHQGHSLEQFLVDYLYYLRNLLELQVGIDNREIILEDTGLAKQQALAISREHLYTVIHSIVKAANEIKYAHNQRLVAELAILESQFIKGSDLTELAARIGVLERNIDKAGRLPVLPEESIEFVSENDPKPVEEVIPPANDGLSEAVRTDPISLTLIQRRWDDILDRVKEQDVITNAILKDAVPKDFNNMKLTLQFNDQFHKEQADSEAKKRIISGVLEAALGARIEVKGIVKKGQVKQQPESVESPKVDIVQQAIDIFGGKIVTK